MFMKKTITTLLFCLFISSIFAQQSPNKNSQLKVESRSKRKAPPKAYHYSNWSVGLSLKSSVENISPHLVYSKILEFDAVPKFSYEIDVFVERKLRDRWVWVSGVNYRGISFELDQSQPVYFEKSNAVNTDGAIENNYEVEFDNAFEKLNVKANGSFWMLEDGEDYEDGEELNFRVRSVNRAQYVGIPLGIKKEVGQGWLRFTTKIGLEPALLVNSGTDYQEYHQLGFHLEGEREDLKKRGVVYPRMRMSNLEIMSTESNLKFFQLNGFFNMGLAHTYKYHTFILEAEWKRGFKAFSQKEDHTSYLQSLGVKVGFIKRFKESKILDLTQPKKIFRW